MRRHAARGVAWDTDLEDTLAGLELVVDAEAVEKVGHNGQDPIPATHVQRQLE